MIEDVKPQVGDFNLDFFTLNVACLDLLYPILFGESGIDWHDNLGSDVFYICPEFYDGCKLN